MARHTRAVVCTATNQTSQQRIKVHSYSNTYLYDLCMNVDLSWFVGIHYDDVIMGAIASQITSLTIVYSTVYSGADQSRHQSSASLAFVWGIHRGPVNSPHKWPVTRKMFPFDDVIMRHMCYHDEYGQPVGHEISQALGQVTWDRDIGSRL